MNRTPECGLCPAFLTDPESRALGRCWGCRQPPAQYIVEKDGTVRPRFPTPTGETREAAQKPTV